MNATPLGVVLWADLTIPGAAGVRNFYQQVVGWRPEAVEMGPYSDFNMFPPDDDQPAFAMRVALTPICRRTGWCMSW